MDIKNPPLLLLETSADSDGGPCMSVPAGHNRALLLVEGDAGCDAAHAEIDLQIPDPRESNGYLTGALEDVVADLGKMVRSPLPPLVKRVRARVSGYAGTPGGSPAVPGTPGAHRSLRWTLSGPVIRLQHLNFALRGGGPYAGYVVTGDEPTLAAIATAAAAAFNAAVPPMAGATWSAIGNDLVLRWDATGIANNSLIVDLWFWDGTDPLTKVSLTNTAIEYPDIEQSAVDAGPAVFALSSADRVLVAGRKLEYGDDGLVFTPISSYTITGFEASWLEVVQGLRDLQNAIVGPHHTAAASLDGAGPDCLFTLTLSDAPGAAGNSYVPRLQYSDSDGSPISYFTSGPTTPGRDASPRVAAWRINNDLVIPGNRLSLFSSIPHMAPDASYVVLPTDGPGSADIANGICAAINAQFALGGFWYAVASMPDTVHLACTGGGLSAAAANSLTPDLAWDINVGVTNASSDPPSDTPGSADLPGTPEVPPSPTAVRVWLQTWTEDLK